MTGPLMSQTSMNCASSRTQPLRVLTIEDDHMLGRMLVRLLAAEGYEVEHVTSGSEGLARCAERRPDVLLLDLMLPDVDGLDVCRALRANGFADLSIIVVSARNDPAERGDALAAGADAFLSKPFHADALLRLVASCPVSG